MFTLRCDERPQDATRPVLAVRRHVAVERYPLPPLVYENNELGAASASKSLSYKDLYGKS
jgi:hypothetical protein